MNHIALVIPGLDRIAGAERQMILLAHGLQRRGWRVSVVALSGTGSTAGAELAAAGIEFLTLHMRKGLADPRGWIRFHRWLRREKPEVVHAHLPHAAWFARWSRLAAPVRVVIDTLHSASTGSQGRKLGYRLSNWLPDKVTAVSQAAADSHLAAGMVTKDKIVVLFNGIDTDFWHPDQAARLAVRGRFGIGDEFLWFAAGRLEPVKDYPTLLRAMVEVPAPARLVIAGAGIEEQSLLQLTAKLGLEQRVRFLGFVPDVRPCMQAADGFVQSSLWEGLPLGPLEAAACALPTVATDVPGTREALIEGVTGYLARPNSPLDLAETMKRMMQIPPADRRMMGTSARQAVADRFSIDSILDRWEGVYADLLRMNPAPRRWGS